MKTNKWIAALMLGAAIVACSPKGSAPAADAADGEKTANDYLPSKAQIDSVSYLLGINFGSFLKGYNFGDVNYAEVVKGMKDFVNSKGNMRSPEFADQFKINPETMNDVFNAYLENRSHYVALVNKEKSDKFLAENAKKDGVQTTESGLQYKIIEAGSDVKPSAQDTVWVNYKGSLIDGTVFDETPEGSDPVQLTLNRVVKGWQEGLQLVGEGGHIELYLPADLGYGEQGTQGIEPNSALIFDVKVSKIGKVAEAPAETPAE